MATYNFEIDKLQYLTIGQQGENNATDIVIDMTSWVDDMVLRGYENPCFHLLFLPYNETVPLTTNTTYDADTHLLTWTITSAVTARDGLGYTEIRAMNHPDNGLLKKSLTIPTTVNSSVTGVEGGTPPAPYDDWMNNILILINQLNNALSNATSYYAISTSATARPDDSTFVDTMPDLSLNKGKYLWTMTKITWSTGATSNLYAVAYLAVDGSGAVTNVNGMAGTIVLDGRNLYRDLSVSVEERVTLDDALAAISLIANAAVKTINNKTGNAVLYGTDISMTSTDATTLKAAIDAKAAANNVANSVNGKSGAVTLYSTEINVSASDSTKVSASLASHQNSIASLNNTVSGHTTTINSHTTTINSHTTSINSLNTTVGNKLDKSLIVYSSSQPAGATGKIWLKPKA